MIVWHRVACGCVAIVNNSTSRSVVPTSVSCIRAMCVGTHVYRASDQVLRLTDAISLWTTYRPIVAAEEDRVFIVQDQVQVTDA